MRAIVTGGAGFIGSHVVDALMARGDDVLVLDDLSNGKRTNIPAARLEVVDIRKPLEDWFQARTSASTWRRRSTFGSRSSGQTTTRR